MKEATGELNMTIVTLVAISAIAALLWFVVWPMIQRMIVNNTCQTYGSNWEARPAGSLKYTNGSDAQLSDWYCCPKDGDENECFGTDLGVAEGGEEGE